MNTWGTTSPSQVRAQAKYDRDHTARFSLKLNLQTDQDIIQWLRKQPSMQGAVKRLIRESIAGANGDRESVRRHDIGSSHPDTEDTPEA